MIPSSNPPCVYMASTSEQSQPVRLSPEPSLPVLLLQWISWQQRSKSPSRFCSPVEISFPWHQAQCYTKPIRGQCHPCQPHGEEEAELLSQTCSVCPRHPREADTIVHKLLHLPRWLAPSHTCTLARAQSFKVRAEEHFSNSSVYEYIQ